jgi:hypothetical protein
MSFIFDRTRAQRLTVRAMRGAAMKCPFTAAQHHKKWGFARLCSGAALAIVCASAMLGSRVDAQETVVPSSQPLAVKRLQPSTTPQGPAEPKTLKPSPVNDPLGICRTDGSVTPEQRALQLGLFLCGRYFMNREAFNPKNEVKTPDHQDPDSLYSSTVIRKGLELFIRQPRSEIERAYDIKTQTGGVSAGDITNLNSLPETSCLSRFGKNEFSKILAPQDRAQQARSRKERSAEISRLGLDGAHVVIVEAGMIHPEGPSQADPVIFVEFFSDKIRRIRFDCGYDG